MHFPFVYEVDVGGHTVAEIEGTALIGIDDAGRDWRVAGIMFERDRRHIVMPATHWLYARLVSALLNQSRHAIEAAWQAQRAEMAREPERLPA